MNFSVTPPSFIQEIRNDPDYFENKKGGLKGALIHLAPQDYMLAVEIESPSHHTRATSVDFIESGAKEGRVFDAPWLIYGPRDPSDDYDFKQEGYNRAYVAHKSGEETIPVFVRYREEDERIPSFIKNSLLSQARTPSASIVDVLEDLTQKADVTL